MEPFSESMYRDDLVTYYDGMRKYRDYPNEARFADMLIRRHAPDAKKVLDICCGTGSHSVEMASMGYEVSGIDGSADMLEMARKKAEKAGVHLELQMIEVSGFRSQKKFPAAYSLGYTFLYMTDYEKAKAFLNTAFDVLEPCGLFFVDFINGWSLIKDFDRDKATYQVDGTTIFHFEQSSLKQKKRIRHIDFQYLIDDHQGSVRTVVASEDLRIFFDDEVKLLMTACGFENVVSYADYHPEPGYEGVPEIIVVSGTKPG